MRMKTNKRRMLLALLVIAGAVVLIGLWNGGYILCRYYVYRGWKANQEGNSEEALKFYRTALEWRGTSVLAYYNIGTIYLDSAEYDKAVEYLTKAIDLAENNIKIKHMALSNRGWVYFQKGQYSLANEDYGLATSINPGDSDSFFSKGLVLNRMGRREDALQCFSKAIELDDGNAQAYIERGYLHGFRGEHEKAIHDFTVAIETDKVDAECYKWRGISYSELGQFDRSAEDFEMALKLIAERDVGIERSLAASYYEMGEFQKTVDILEDVVPLIKDSEVRTAAYLMLVNARKQLTDDQ